MSVLVEKKYLYILCRIKKSSIFAAYKSECKGAVSPLISYLRADNNVVK